MDESSSFRVTFGFLLLLMFIAMGGGITMFLRGLEMFPLKFDVRVIVAILGSITIIVSIANHIQIRFAKSK